MPELTPGGYRFQPGWFMTVITILFVALTVGLGRWQTGRAEQKEQVQQRLDALAAALPEALPATVVEGAEWLQHRVSGRGRFRGTFLLDNRVYKGAAGYHVISPFCAEASTACVLVNRGWVAAGPRRDALPAVDAPDGVVDVEGTAVSPPPPAYELGNAPAEQGILIQHLVIEKLAARTGLKLQSFIVLQSGATKDGLVRDWPRPDANSDRNRAYALQWYVMAVVGLALWIGLNLKRNSHAG